MEQFLLGEQILKKSSVNKKGIVFSVVPAARKMLAHFLMALFKDLACPVTAEKEVHTSIFCSNMYANS